MRESIEPRLSKWPFFLGDLLLLGTAFMVYSQSRLPLGLWPLTLLVLCVLAGALLGVTPFLLDFRAGLKAAETGALTSAVAQIQQLEKLASQISGATAQWQNVQEEARKTSNAAKGIADKMASEVQSFTDFMQRMNDSEKSALRLEVEKLRRAEAEWLQVLVRLLDHVFALHTGALRSGQAHLIQQLSQFQNACRDVARRVGLSPFAAEPAEPFDPQRHQVLELGPDGKVAEGATVAETVATGYTYQGRLLRPVLVRLNNGNGTVEAVAGAVPGAEAGQNELPLPVPQ